MIIANARISGRAQDPPTEAIAIRDGRILAIGALEDVRGAAGAGVPELDAGGRRIIPGLIDSHAHVLRAGLTWEREVHWSAISSLEQGLAMIADRAPHALPAGANGSR